MEAQELIDYCLKKKEAYVDFPFGDGTIVIKVKGRIFAQLFMLKGVLSATLNCSKEGGMFYRKCIPMLWSEVIIVQAFNSRILTPSR